MKTIEILIHPTGETQVDAVGFSGLDCEQATAFLEAALGQVRERKRKPEYQQRARARQLQRVRS